MYNGLYTLWLKRLLAFVKLRHHLVYKKSNGDTSEYFLKRLRKTCKISNLLLAKFSPKIKA